ncbi:MAG: NACHT domain-containing protein [Leptolyngbyaceae cyanobacterium RU_5_1]|nr:NACHT domain-containing protein [Leptolyngbyaceae cyanobacterium RU_5_1]
MPIELNSEMMPDSTEEKLRETLQSTFAKNQFQLLIAGEGGVGKTSLACQIARWAMAEDETERLCKHPVMPVLIEDELESTETKNFLLKTITKQLQNLRVEEEFVSEELLKQLLKKRRVLVIVDHLSEMNEITQKAIKELPDTDLPINALVITSRKKKGVLHKHIAIPIESRTRRILFYLRKSEFLMTCKKLK